MLESTDETSCYHWGRQGTTFVIDDTNEFSKAVLPRYVNKTKEATQT
jgi:osomolarity two-component system response regulator SKN7